MEKQIDLGLRAVVGVVWCQHRNNHGDNCSKIRLALFSLFTRWPWQPNDTCP